MHVICASPRVWSLPGGLLPSHQEAEYSFSGHIPTNKQTNKQTNFSKKDNNFLQTNFWTLDRNKQSFNESRKFLWTSYWTSLQVDFHGRVRVPILGALPIMVSVSLTHLFSLLPVAMILCRVCMLSDLPVCLSMLRALRDLCSDPSLFSWPPFCLLCSFSPNSAYTYVTLSLDVHLALPICLSSSSVYISICLIHVFVYVTLYTHFPPLSHSNLNATIAISICIYLTIFVSWPLISWMF